MQIVTFQSAGSVHGIPILAVEEFFRPVPITPVPLADHRVAGLMNLRGKSATVLHLDRCFTHAPPVSTGLSKMILLETTDRLTDEARELGVRTFDQPVVLLVERILDIVALNPSDLQPRPAHVAERFVAGVWRVGTGYVSLLDLTMLMQELLQASESPAT